MTDVIIIGGGASGMTAAIQAAHLGVSVCVLEKKDRVGRKLLTTGNGRCNLSNRDLDFSHYHGSMTNLLPKLWKRMDAERVEEFWRELGIDYVEGENGKVYPRSLQAGSVVNALRRKIDELDIEVRTDTPVQEIRRIHQGYLVITEKETLQAKAVILCAGGKAYPKLGADGEGARLAKNLKMQVNPLRPALCRLNLDFPYLKRISGVKLTIPISLYWDGVCQQTQKGEVLFTDTGVSGPPVLNLSRMAGEGLAQKKQLEVVLDLVPEMESGELFSYMMERMKRLSSWTLEEALEGWLPKKLVPVILLMAEVDRLQTAGSLNKRQIGAVCRVLKAFAAPISGLAGWEEAQITVGGIAEKEVTERLESRKHKGLFLAGEVLDLDGNCGGYNLQWAVGSALIAAEEAEKFVRLN